jgi:hypothetical protein
VKSGRGRQNRKDDDEKAKSTKSKAATPRRKRVRDPWSRIGWDGAKKRMKEGRRKKKSTGVVTPPKKELMHLAIRSDQK